MGWVAGMAFWGFTLAMVFGGPLCDIVGMGRLLVLAFIGHLAGVVWTIFAGGFWSLFLSTLLVGVGNGMVEAACNPLIATLYPTEKTKKLNQFHVWFPGGIAIGGIIAYLLDQSGMGWQAKMAVIIPPTIAYGIMFWGMKFPQTERVESGVSTKDMYAAAATPLFIFMAACMCLTANTELATNQWIGVLLENVGVPAILVLVWINTLMAVGRQFAGPVAHSLAPSGMLLASAAIAALGLYWLSMAGGMMAFVAASVFAVGICYFWPTMLAFVAEYIPKSGALGLAIMGGIGNVAVFLANPLVGKVYDGHVAENLPSGQTVDVLRGAAEGTPARSSVGRGDGRRGFRDAPNHGDPARDPDRSVHDPALLAGQEETRSPLAAARALHGTSAGVRRNAVPTCTLWRRR